MLARDLFDLRATLRDAGGHLEFATDRRVEVVPGASKVVEFRLVKVTD